MTATINIQDVVLNKLRTEHMPCSIYLTSGIKLQGNVSSFDRYVIVLQQGTTMQLVYKHAVSTVVPSRPIELNS